MRIIIKDECIVETNGHNNHIAVIAGEIINLYFSQFIFENGQLVSAEKRYIGYPQIIDGNFTYTITLTDMVKVYTIQKSLDVDKTVLDNQIEIMMEQARKENIKLNHPEYHIKKTYLATKIKEYYSSVNWPDNIKNEVAKKHVEEQDQPKNKSKIKAQRYPPKEKKSTLSVDLANMWYTQILDINDAQISRIVSERTLGTILFNSDNSIKLNEPHNSVVYYNNLKLFKENNKVLTTGIKLRLVKSESPLYINFKSIKKCKINRLEGIIQLISYDDAIKITTINNCYKCDDLLFDYNYILGFNKKYTNTLDHIEVICPLCAGCKEQKPDYIFKFKIPVDYNKFIETKIKDSILQDIMYEVLKNITFEEEYVTIGDKYIGVENIHHFIMNGGSIPDDKKLIEYISVTLAKK